MTSKQMPRTRLNLTALEERDNASVSVVDGDLYIYGTKGDDHVEVHYELGCYKVTENGVQSWCDSSAVWDGKIYFFGGPGNDSMINNSSMSLTARGGDGNDTLSGGAAMDFLHGESGDDVLYGYDGIDFLHGGSGYDMLYGMSGDDFLYGGEDGVSDYLNGGNGRDRFKMETITILFFHFNRDAAADYVPGEDVYW
jgi:Ca2+-binding RTX toxin-like protein